MFGSDWQRCTKWAPFPISLRYEPPRVEGVSAVQIEANETIDRDPNQGKPLLTAHNLFLLQKPRAAVIGVGRIVCRRHRIEKNVLPFPVCAKYAHSEFWTRCRSRPYGNASNARA